MFIFKLIILIDERRFKPLSMVNPQGGSPRLCGERISDWKAPTPINLKLPKTSQIETKLTKDPSTKTKNLKVIRIDLTKTRPT